MIVVNVTREQLEAALASVSQRFGHNIIWNRSPEAMNKTGTRWRLTLRCTSSRGPGHSVTHSAVSFGGNPRRLVSACWHVHGYFMDALPYGAIAYPRGGVVYPNDTPWQDYNVGSLMYPRYASESCDCDDESDK